MHPSSHVWKTSIHARRGLLNLGSLQFQNVNRTCRIGSIREMSPSFSTNAFDFSFGRKDKQKVSSDNTNDQARRISPDTRIFTCASHCNFLECHRILHNLIKEGRISNRHFQRYFEGASVGLKKVLDNTEPNGIDILKASGDLLPTIQQFLKENLRRPKDVLLTDALIISMLSALEVFTSLSQIEAILNILHAVKYKQDYQFMKTHPGKQSPAETQAMHAFYQQIKGEPALDMLSVELTNILDDSTILIVHDHAFEMFLTSWVRSLTIVRSPQLHAKPHFGKDVYGKIFDVYKRSYSVRIDLWVDFYEQTFGELPLELQYTVLNTYSRIVSSMTQVSLGSIYHDSFVMLTPNFMIESFCKDFMPHLPTKSLTDILYMMNASCTKALKLFNNILQKDPHPSLPLLVDYLTILTRSIIPIQTIENQYGTTQVQECSAGHSLTARLNHLRTRVGDMKHKNMFITNFKYLPNISPISPNEAVTLDHDSWPFIHSDSEQYLYPNIGSKPNLLNRTHHDISSRSYRITLANPIDAVLSGTPLSAARSTVLLHRNQVLLSSILTTQQTFLHVYYRDMSYKDTFDDSSENIKQVKSILIEALLRADQPAVASSLILDSMNETDASSTLTSQYEWKQWNIYELSSRLYTQFQHEQMHADSYKEGFQPIQLQSLLSPQTEELNLWLPPLTFVPLHIRQTLYRKADMQPADTLDRVYQNMQNYYNNTSLLTNILTNVPNVYTNYELVGVYACQTGDIPLALAIYTRLMNEMQQINNNDVIYSGKLAQFCIDISFLLLQIPVSRILDTFSNEEIPPPVFPGIVHPELRSIQNTGIVYDDLTCLEMVQQAMTILGNGVYKTKYGINTSPTLILALANIASFCGDIATLTSLVKFAEKTNVLSYIAQWLPNYYAVAYIQVLGKHQKHLTKHTDDYYKLIDSIQQELEVCVRSITASEIDPLWQQNICSDNSGFGDSQRGLIKLNPERTSKHLIRIFSYGVDREGNTGFAHLLFNRDNFLEAKHGTIMDSIKDYPPVLKNWVNDKVKIDPLADPDLPVDVNDISTEAKFFKKNLIKFQRDQNLLKLIPYLDAVVEGRYAHDKEDPFNTAYTGTFHNTNILCDQAMHDFKAIHLKCMQHIGDFYQRKTNILPIEPNLLSSAPARTFFSPLSLMAWLMLNVNTRPMEGIAFLRDVSKIFNQDLEKVGFVYLPEVLLAQPTSTKWADSTGETFNYEHPTSATYMEYELYFRKSMLLLGYKYLEKHQFKMAREMLLHSVLGIDHLSPITQKQEKVAQQNPPLHSKVRLTKAERNKHKFERKYIFPYFKSLPKISSTCPFTAQEMFYYTSQIACLYPFSKWLVQQSSLHDVFNFMHGDVSLSRVEQDPMILKYVTHSQLSAIQSVLRNTQKYLAKSINADYNADTTDVWIYDIVKTVVDQHEQVKLEEAAYLQMHKKSIDDTIIPDGENEEDLLSLKDATEDHILARMVYTISCSIVECLNQADDKLFFSTIQAAVFTRIAATSIANDTVVMDVIRRNTTVSMASISLLQQLKFVQDIDPQTILQGSVQGSLRNYLHAKITSSFSSAELSTFVNVIVSLGETGSDQVDSEIDNQIERFWKQNDPIHDDYM